MTDKNLIVIDDPATAGSSGADDNYGSIDLNTISRATNLANDAFATAEEAKNVPDDFVSLREAVNKLSDAVNLLADQLYQIGTGIREGRITVVDLKE
jgi:hypothetical protein